MLQGRQNPGCEFFDWFYEGVNNTNDQMIMKLRAKIEDLTKKLDEAKQATDEALQKLNEENQKVQEASFVINVKNETLEAQKWKIVSLEHSLKLSRKLNFVAIFFGLCILIAILFALGGKRGGHIYQLL